MSAGAVGVEKRCLVNNSNNSNSSNTNNAYECINVDINSILRDVNAYKRSRKRNVRGLYENDTSINDEKTLNKKMKLENFIGTKSEDDVILSQEGEIYSEDIQITSDDSNENRNEKHAREGNKHSANKKIKNADRTYCVDIPNESHISENKIYAKNQETIEANEKKLTKKIDTCIDNVLESIRSCNEIGEAKKIITPILNSFIRNNFIYADDSEENSCFFRNQFHILHKEKRILKSALKWQYQMIKQSQNVIDSQKIELRKKNDELNQIKAKVHQYFYELSNPSKESFQPYIFPDVY